MGYSILLQPVCTPDFKHVADELLYRDAEGVVSSMLTPGCMIARASSAAFFEVGLQQLVGTRTLIMRVTADVIRQLAALEMPAEQIMLRLEDSVAALQSVEDELTELRAVGYRLMLDPDQAEVLALAASDWLRTVLPTDMERLVRLRRPSGVRLLVDGITTQSAFEHALALGGDWIQGPFFSAAIMVPTPLRNRRGNLAARLRLLRELYQPEPDMGRIENLLSQDPHLVLLVLRQANNSIAYQRREVVSLRQASMLLGLDRLQSMITQLLLANDSPLCALKLKQMLMRAAMCKRLAARLELSDPNAAFAIGLFSLMDQYHGVGMSELIEMIPFTTEVKAALLQRNGPLGRLLKLIESFEQAQLGGRPQPVVEMLNAEYLDSLIWLQQVYIDQHET